MLKIFIVLGVIAIIFGYFYNRDQKFQTVSPEITSTISPAPLPKNLIEMQFDERNYRLVYEPLAGKTVRLIPNFTEKRSGAAIAEQNSCAVASSGGFYTPEDKPLGLFKTNGKIFGNRINNSSLITGFLSVTETGELYIDSETSMDHPIILQSGPLFTSNKPFPTKQDEYARRNLILEDIQGNEYIATLFSSENTYDGPRLTDLPDILFSISSPFRVQRALNLDGGSASFFKLRDDFMVSEIVAVGSVICVE